MSKRQVLAAEVLGSTIVGVATGLLGDAVALGVIAGLVTFVISMQIQTAGALADRDDETNRVVAEFRPIAALEAASPKSKESLLELAKAEASYLSSVHSNGAFDLELAHQTSTLIDLYRSCANGSMRLQLTPSAFLRETDGVYTVKKVLKATSVVNAIDYWDSQSGLSYLAKQEELLRGGVQICRVFVEERATLSDLRSVAGRHREWIAEGLPVSARVAFIEDLTADLAQDYAVVDENLVIRLEQHRGTPHAVVYERGAASIDKASKLFDRLWSLAVDFDSFPELG